MKGIPNNRPLDFDAYDAAKLKLVSRILPVILADALENVTEPTMPVAEVREQIVEEAILLAEVALKRLYGDRLVCDPEERVDLVKESRRS